MTIDFAQQFKLGVKAAKDVMLSGKFNQVIFCGVGGSALPADIISMLWIKGLNAYIHKGYGLPYFADSNCLVICTSWSGNTEEIISSFQTAQAKGLTTIAVTRGGQLASLARAGQAPLVILPDDQLPARLAVGYTLSALLTLLNNSAIIGYSFENLIEEAGKGTFQQNSNIGIGAIGTKIPLIYSSFSWRYLARLWKINFNENCKTHAFFSYFPEAAHNEITGFQTSQTKHYFPIVLIDRAEEIVAVAKLDKFIGFLKAQGFDHAVVDLVGQSRLEKILNNYNQAVAVSTALAETLDVDPLDTAIIEKFKQL